MIRVIHLYGAIAKQADIELIELDVNSPRELVAALRSQVSNWREIMITHPNMHIVLSSGDKQTIDAIVPELFEFPLSEKAEHIHIFSAVEGAGIELTAWLVMNMEIGLTAATFISAAVTNLAVSVVVGLVSSALSASPDTSSGSEKADQRPSFLFNGAVNVVEQGYPVPLVYGIHTAGSIVVSAGVDVAELPYESTQATAPVSGTGDTQPAIPAAQTWQWTGN